MKNVLKRSQLLEAQHTFECEDWVNPIKEILDSTNDENIEIEDKYLDLIKEEATCEQIIFCKALNLDLKWNIPVKAKEFVLEKLKACEVIKLNQFITLYKENGKNIFELYSTYKQFWFDYFEIYEVLEEKYSLNYNEMIESMNIILEEHF